MAITLSTIFITGLELTGPQRLMLMWPLCLAIAVVYKTVRCEKLTEIVSASLILWVTIIFVMYAIGIALWAVFELLV